MVRSVNSCVRRPLWIVSSALDRTYTFLERAYACACLSRLTRTWFPLGSSTNPVTGHRICDVFRNPSLCARLFRSPATMVTPGANGFVTVRTPHASTGGSSMFTVDTIAPRGSNWVVNSSAKSGRAKWSSKTKLSDQTKRRLKSYDSRRRGEVVAAHRAQADVGARRRGRGSRLCVMGRKKRCSHGKRKDNCVDCNGCPHGKHKRLCADCKGCPHGKLKYNCAACKGCPHGKRKDSCAACNPCPHGKLKRNCVDCNPCPHGKMKRSCVDCNPCPHGKLKRFCADCNPCPHGKLKQHCTVCSGCEHGKRKDRCKACKSARAEQPAAPEIKPEIKLEPEIKQEPFTIRGYFGIGD